MEKNKFNEDFFETQIKIRDYFRQKTKEIIAKSSIFLSDHPTEIGTHREVLIQEYLREIIPKRYSINSGTIYGKYGKSKQTDVVIWDTINYPVIKSLGHNAYFAETVKVAIEIKSSYSSDNFKDILEKTKAIKSIVHDDKYLNHEERIANLENHIEAFLENRMYHGFVKRKNPIGVVAVIFKGGENFNLEIVKKLYPFIDEQFPDLMIFIKTGKLFIKQYSFDEDSAQIKGTYTMIEANEDAILFFTCHLLGLISSHSVHFDTPFFLDEYLYLGYIDSNEYLFNGNLKSQEISFPIGIPPQGTGLFDKI